MLMLLGAVAAVFSAVLMLQGGPKFIPGACERLELHLSQRVVGQDMALSVLTSTICDHLEQATPQRPHILSVHGPPGVGKTLTHREIAKALYFANPNRSMECPGADCPAYKVLVGLDYDPSTESDSLEALRASIISHVQHYPDTLLVVEEYDKLTCVARNMLVKLFRHSETYGINFNRAVVLLESNIGSVELEKLLTRTDGWTATGGTDRGDELMAVSKRTPSKQVSPDEVDSLLRDLVFAKWQKQGCSDFDDINKFTNTISYFLPYFPLQLSHVTTLVEMALEQQGEKLRSNTGGRLVWSAAARDLLASKVEFDGHFARDGGSKVDSIVTVHVGRHVRRCPRTGPSGTHPPLLQLIAVKDGTIQSLVEDLKVEVARMEAAAGSSTAHNESV